MDAQTLPRCFEGGDPIAAEGTMQDAVPPAMVMVTLAIWTAGLTDLCKGTESLWGYYASKAPHF